MIALCVYINTRARLYYYDFIAFTSGTRQKRFSYITYTIIYGRRAKQKKTQCVIYK